MGYQAKSAIVGLGISEMGKVYGRSATSFALEAVGRAIEDAGLTKDQVDGLLMQPGIAQPGIGLPMQNQGGFKNLRLVNHMNAMGATPASMVQYASWAVQNGVANYVVCVFADAPLQEGRGAGNSMTGARRPAPPTGFASLDIHYSPMNPNAGYAMAARRHMPSTAPPASSSAPSPCRPAPGPASTRMAQFRTPITIEDHQASRWIAEPFHLLDCCLVSNGAVAVIVTSVERADDLQLPPAYVLGDGAGLPRRPAPRRRHTRPEHRRRHRGARRCTAGSASPPKTSTSASCTTATRTPSLVTLEDYGFCAKGEGGAVRRRRQARPRRRRCRPTPAAASFSAFYMWGMTPMSEGVIQARGQGGERQVAKNDLVLVTGNGGILDYHASLILSPHRN